MIQHSAFKANDESCRYDDMNSLSNSAYARPDVFQYHDIHEFLNDFFLYIKNTDRHFSMRKLAERAGLSTSTLPSILTRKIAFTQQTLAKIGDHLDLSKSEFMFLEWLRQLSEAPTLKEKIKAYKIICRYHKYRKKNSPTIEAHHYLHKWYYAAIRELVKWPDFELDPKWIRQQLYGRITIAEAKDAIRFLTRHGYIVIDTKGRATLSQKHIEARGGVYKLAMAEYYNQVLSQALNSIYETPAELRELNVFTFAFAQEEVPKIKEIFLQAIEQIRKIQVDDKQKNSVYQATLLAFPVGSRQRRAT